MLIPERRFRVRRIKDLFQPLAVSLRLLYGGTAVLVGDDAGIFRLRNGGGRQLHEGNIAVLQRFLGRQFACHRRLTCLFPGDDLGPKYEPEDQKNEVDRNRAPSATCKRSLERSSSHSNRSSVRMGCSMYTGLAEEGAAISFLDGEPPAGGSMSSRSICVYCRIY